MPPLGMQVQATYQVTFPRVCPLLGLPSRQVGEMAVDVPRWFTVLGDITVNVGAWLGAGICSTALGALIILPVVSASSRMHLSGNVPGTEVWPLVEVLIQVPV